MSFVPTLLALCGLAIAAPSPAQRPSAATAPSQRWIAHFRARSFHIGGFRSALRGSTLTNRAIPNRRSAAEISRVVAKLEQRAAHDRKAFVAAVERLGGRVRRVWWIINAAAIELPVGREDAVRGLPDVAWLERDRVHVPLAAPIRTATNATHHRADIVQARGIKGTGVTAAVLDTGQDERYPVLNPCPCSNIAPPFPTRAALATGMPHAIALTAASKLALTGFAISGYAERPARLAVTVWNDRNGSPNRSLGTTSVTLGIRPAFATGKFRSAIPIAAKTRYHISVQAGTGARVFLDLPSGDPSTVRTRIAGTWRAKTRFLGYRVLARGCTPCRPHRTYFKDGKLSNPHRLQVNRKIGRLSADDRVGHGTAVASVIAGANWGTRGADHGHAYDARIAGYGVADTPAGGAFSSTIVSAWQKVLCDIPVYGVVTANFSYSGSDNPLSATQKALDAVAYNGDLLITTAAGGGPSSRSQISINGISVGATDVNKRRLQSSIVGPVRGQVFPDLVAHGQRVVMARADKEAADFVGTGTSYASAQVCGIATLVRAAARSMSAIETKAVLLASAEASPGTGARQVNGVGCGYPLADRAIQIASDVRQHGTSVLRGRGARERFLFDAKSGQRVQIAIAWHRRDVNRATAPNIDLVIRDPRGGVVATSATTTNSEEFLRYVPRATGRFSFEIIATQPIDPIVKIGWASSVPSTRGSARYSVFETGCKGSGGGGGCPKLKQDSLFLDGCPALMPKTTYALLVQCPCPLTVQGFSLYSKAALPATPVQCALYVHDGVGPEWKPQATPVRVGTMTVGTAPGLHTVTFTTPYSLSAAEAANFYIAFTTPDDTSIWADNGTMRQGHHWERPLFGTSWIGDPGGFQGTYGTISWDWRVQCTPDPSCPGGPIVVVDPVLLPTLGNARFAVRVSGAPQRSPCVLLTGAPGRCVDLGPTAPT